MLKECSMDRFNAFLKFSFYTLVWILSITFLSPSLYLLAEEIPYGTGSWDSDSLGNHRVVIRVNEKADAVWAHIQWRRRDVDPEKKNVILIDAKTGSRVGNILRVEINRESGDLIFQPQTVPGEYFVYYMPYIMSGRSNYPAVTYPEPEQTAETDWIERHGLSEDKLSGLKKDAFPLVQVVEFQSIDEFNSFYPMEVIATSEETGNMLRNHPESDYLLFPEDRKFPIRMWDDLPFKWIKTGPKNMFQGDAARGEFYVFQIGVYAARKAIEDIDVSFTEMKHTASKTTIPSSALRCINVGGIDWNGEELDKICPVDKGKVQPLWCGIRVPMDARPGKYEGTVTVKPKGMEETPLKLVINVTKDALKDAGDSELWRHSRLRWLDSKIAFDDDAVPPFTPIMVRGKTFSFLGRRVRIGKTGFPDQIRSSFSPEVTTILDEDRDILSSPIALIVEDEENRILSWEAKDAAIVKIRPGAVVWEAESEAGPLALDCSARVECDGFLEFKVKLSSAKNIKLRDIRLEIPIIRDVAKYAMGMGIKGGFRPETFHWKWDQKKNQDSVWVGDVNAGLQVSFRAENYSRPLNTNFYLSKPLNMPPSWYNNGKGGCRIEESGENTVLITSYSGPRTIKANETLHFHFNLLLTPFKTIDTQSHWKNRFYHAYKPVDEIAGTGANTINNHHANEVNPYINYPFIHTRQMKEYIDEAHAKGIKVKIYNTIRELSNHAVEIFALRSLGEEIFSPGPGGGYSWLQEHLGSNYIAAWFVPRLKDAAVINSGMSRWHNYYLEGLNWLVRNIGIDGLYIDDVAYDRTTMKRVRKILDRGRKGALIDLHSANQFNPRDGFANSANLYLEHFPYINRLWFGEYFDYNSSPDFWLIEVSGIPFGIMGEMLQGGGNPWRGMIFGMTSRLPWAGDPRALWKVWDDFGIQDSRMVGYWSPSCPVKTDNPEVLATAYVKKDCALISIASWAEDSVLCNLNIDWEALGMDPENVQLRAPFIKDFQGEITFKPSDRIPVDSGKGWLLILEEKEIQQ
jgi:hypothetical protein